MGYDSRVLGEITIDPPIAYENFRSSAHRSTAPQGSDTTLIFVEDLTTVETSTGVNHNITAVGITVRYAESGRHYRIKEELQHIIDNYPQHHQYAGELVVVGAEPGDIMRYRIKRFQADSAHGEQDFLEVVEEKAMLSWPDGSKVEFP